MKSLSKIITVSLVLLAFTLNANAVQYNNKGKGPSGTGNSGNGVGNTGPGNQGNDKPVGNAGGNNGNGSSDSIPLDGGLGILLAGAAYFGVKKLRKK